ncbi:hypothetical protein [Streptomyces tailanensis]|uniref:hypothetical protein n=1 Tax=Streptomyces tailanensis TaxID=2569858 RepID=UPI003CCC5ED5
MTSTNESRVAPATDQQTPPASSGLHAGLKNRHLSMIAIGGVIGADLFVGSSSGIATAGPGILLSWSSSPSWARRSPRWPPARRRTRRRR